MFTIGYFDDSAGPGGTTRYLHELLTALDRERYRPVIFSPRPAPWHESMRALGADVVTGPVLQVAPRPPVHAAADVAVPPVRPVARPPAGALHAARHALAWHLGQRRELRTLEALFRRQRVDLLHTNNVGEELAPIAARRAGVPRLVGTLHVDPSYDLLGERSSARFRRLKLRSLQSLDLAIAVSESTAASWRQHLGLTMRSPPPMVVIPNGIQLRRLARRRDVASAKAHLGVPATDLVIGSIGRLDYAKGYADLLDALPIVLAAVPDARFVHAGGGPLAAALRAEAERRGIAARITWLGFQDDVRNLLEAADVYVQPSWCEAQGIGVLEAAALDVPVVATAVGGLPETLAFGAAGWLAPPRDPEALARHLVEALRTPMLRQQHASALRTRLHEHYTQDHMVTSTMAQYHRLLTAAR